MIRFSEIEIERGANRIKCECANADKDIYEIIRAYDNGHGDIDDVIDAWENDMES